MALLGQLRARLGAARLALEDYPSGSDLHRLHSELQANALINLIKERRHELTDEDKLTASSLVQTGHFHRNDSMAILRSLTVKAPGQIRRDAQDFTTFMNFLGTVARMRIRCGGGHGPLDWFAC